MAIIASCQSGFVGCWSIKWKWEISTKEKLRWNYTEKRGKKIQCKIRKSHYDARFFINRIGNAISEEKQLCENVDALIDEVGCNIGAALINDLQIEAGLDI